MKLSTLGFQFPFLDIRSLQPSDIYWISIQTVKILMMIEVIILSVSANIYTLPQTISDYIISNNKVTFMHQVTHKTLLLIIERKIKCKIKRD